jgi:hypothetical protein
MGDRNTVVSGDHNTVFPDATIIIEGRERKISPEKNTRSDPAIGNVGDTDYDLGPIKPPGLKIEHFIEGSLGPQAYKFSVDRRVDSQVSLCDVHRPVKVSLRTGRGSFIKSVSRANSVFMRKGKPCSYMESPLNPGEYRLEVSASKDEASNYAINVDLSDR